MFERFRTCKAPVGLLAPVNTGFKAEPIDESLLDCINIGERMAVNGAWLRKNVEMLLSLLKETSPQKAEFIGYAKKLYVIPNE